MTQSNSSLIITIAIIIMCIIAGLYVANVLNKTGVRAKVISDSAITRSIGNSIDIMNIYGKTKIKHQFDHMFLEVRIREASDPLVFSDTLLSVTARNETSFYNYDENIDCRADIGNSSDSFSIANINNSNNYGVRFKVKINDDGDYRGIDDGDIIEVCVKTPLTIYEGDFMHISMVASKTTPRKIKFQVPKVLVGTYFLLYPELGSVY